VARREATLEALWRCLDAGHPAIVCVDINNTHTFMPDQLGGQHTHFAVVEGYFDAAPPAATGPPRRFLIVQQTNRRAPIPSVWPLDVFEPSWRGAGWRGRYRRRRMPPRVAAQLAWQPHEAGATGAPAAAGAGAKAGRLGEALRLHRELIAAGLLEPAGGGAVRLAPEQELHHDEDELRQLYVHRGRASVARAELTARRENTYYSSSFLVYLCLLAEDFPWSAPSARCRSAVARSVPRRTRSCARGPACRQRDPRPA